MNEGGDPPGRERGVRVEGTANGRNKKKKDATVKRSILLRSYAPDSKIRPAGRAEKKGGGETGEAGGNPTHWNGIS